MDIQKYLAELSVNKLRTTLNFNHQDAQRYEITASLTSRQEITTRLAKIGSRAKDLVRKTRDKPTKAELEGFLKNIYEPFMHVITDDQKWAEYEKFLQPAKLRLVSSNFLSWGRITSPNELHPQFFIIENAGGGILNFDLRPDVPWIRLENSRGSLQANQQQRIKVVLDYQKINQHGAVQGTISLPNGEKITVEVELVPAKMVLLSPTNLDFGRVVSLDQLKPQYITFKNEGGGVLNFDLSSKRNWVNLEPQQGALSMGEQQRIKVSLDYWQIGEPCGRKQSVIHLPNGQRITITVETVPPKLEILTEQVDFGEVNLPTDQGVTRTVVVRNAGGYTLKAQVKLNHQFDWWLKVEPLTFQLGPNGKRDITLRLNEPDIKQASTFASFFNIETAEPYQESHTLRVNAQVSLQPLTAVCPDCGHTNDLNEVFCQHCAYLLIEDVSCPKCHAKVPNGPYCIECGQQLQVQA